MSETRALRETFNAVAATYQAARPDYPAALYDDLVADARQHGTGPNLRSDMAPLGAAGKSRPMYGAAATSALE